MSVGRKPVTFQNVTGIAAGLIKNRVLCARSVRQCRLLLLLVAQQQLQYRLYSVEKGKEKEWGRVLPIPWDRDGNGFHTNAQRKRMSNERVFVVAVEKRNMLANQLVKRQGNNNDNISNQKKTQIGIRGRHSCVTLSPSFDRSIPLQLCLSSRVLGYQTVGNDMG